MQKELFRIFHKLLGSQHSSAARHALFLPRPPCLCSAQNHHLAAHSASALTQAPPLQPAPLPGLTSPPICRHSNLTGSPVQCHPFPAACTRDSPEGLRRPDGSRGCAQQDRRPLLSSGRQGRGVSNPALLLSRSNTEPAIPGEARGEHARPAKPADSRLTAA